jgi:DNA invertase Pin-like site-specific DNA recombinase
MKSTGVTVGYARASTRGRPLKAQLKALRAAGVADWHVFADTVGGTAAQRPKLEELRRFVTKGDTVVVTKLDRMGRSLGDLRAILDGFQQKGIALVVLEPGIDTSTEAGEALIHMAAVFAEFESAIRRERQLEGVAKARAKGVRLGRRRSVEPDAVVAAYREHGSIGATAKALGSSKPTVHRVLKAAGVDTSGRGARASKPGRVSATDRPDPPPPQ